MISQTDEMNLLRWLRTTAERLGVDETEILEAVESGIKLDHFNLIDSKAELQQALIRAEMNEVIESSNVLGCEHKKVPKSPF